MLAVHHWYENYPRRLREAYVSVLVVSWVVVAAIIGAGKLNQIRLDRLPGGWTPDGNAGARVHTVDYTRMPQPHPIDIDIQTRDQPVVEPQGPGPDVENVTTNVPLPVRDDSAEVATMATSRQITGPSGPSGTGPGAPVFIRPETVKAAIDDVHPAPANDWKRWRADRMPMPLQDPTPEYPDRARAMSIEGKVSLDLWLRKDGTVSVVQIHASSGNALLDSAASRAAAMSTYEPARAADGSPVNVWVRRQFTFSLTGGR